jgi:hypothetical protein
MFGQLGVLDHRGLGVRELVVDAGVDRDIELDRAGVLVEPVVARMPYVWLPTLAFKV